MTKRLKGILRSLLLTAVGLILGVNLYLWNAKSLTGNTLPMPFGYGMALVLTGSMEPAIGTDDLILVKAQDHYETGDIVVYQSNSMMVVHRILQTDGETVVTKGDANNAPDEPIPAATIKGRVIGVLSGLGTGVRLLKNPKGSLLLAAAAFVLLELSFRRERKKDDEELEKLKAEIRRLKAEQE